MIPARTVTQLSGDGGVGKSIVAKQLGLATAADKPWFGMSVENGPVIYISAEDEVDELHRRLNDIAASYGIDLANLDNFHLIPLAGLDAVLAAPSKPGVIEKTAVWRGLVALVEKIRPRLVIIDTAADAYAGDENKRAEVRQFIGLLRGLAIHYDLAVLLLSHPSLSGMATGSGTSGSTAWSNSVRSRLYLETLKGDDGREIDPDLRVLSVKKTNYGPPGIELHLRWSLGCFVLEGQSPQGLSKFATEAKAERIFLELLSTFNDQGRDVSTSYSRNYAPTAFARHPDAEGLRKDRFEDAMNRLLKEKRILIETSGPPSKRRSRLVEAPISFKTREQEF